MLGPELEQAIRRALEDATRRRHEFSGLEHLLLALLDDKKTTEVIRQCGGKPTRVRTKLEEFLQGPLPAMWRHPPLVRARLLSLPDQYINHRFR